MVVRSRPAFGIVAIASMVALGSCTEDDAHEATKQERQDACLSDVGLDPSSGYYDEALSDETCRCVVATDDRPFGESADLSGAPPPDPDRRAEDPALSHWAAEIRRTRCGCCHNTAFRGSGTRLWDVAFPGVWTDSAPDARLRLMAGHEDRPGQTLPFPDLEPFAAFVEEEIARREAARAE